MNNTKLNSKIMTVHATSFGIFLLVTTAFTVAVVNWTRSLKNDFNPLPPIPPKIIMVAYSYDDTDLLPYLIYVGTDVVNVLCMFITSILLCFIFLNLEHTASDERGTILTKDEFGEVVVEEFNERDFHQLRLWKQFMRDPDDRPSIYRSTI